MTVLIFTPMALEFKAVSRHLEGNRETLVEDGMAYVKGTFKGRHHLYTIWACETGVKNITTALAVERAIQRHKPNVCLLLGVAGGLKADVKVGDVVVATSAYEAESGKEVDNHQFFPRTSEYPFSRQVSAYAQVVSREDNWKNRTGDHAPEAVVVLGPIAGGEKVIAAAQTVGYERLRQYLSHALAIEMEAVGFGSAIQSHRDVHAIAIRGISDMCEGKNAGDDRNWQPIAAERAAAVAFEVLWEMDGASFIQMQKHSAQNIKPASEKLDIPDDRKESPRNGLPEVALDHIADHANANAGSIPPDMPNFNPPSIEYDFFICYPSADAAEAMALKALLDTKHKVFLDQDCLQPGENWTMELSNHQAAAKMTIALISRNYSSAIYAQEEVATGIAFERRWSKDRHCVVPVYLNGIPQDIREIPYGLRCKQSIVKIENGMVGVAKKLSAMLASIPQQADDQPQNNHPLHKYPVYPAVPAEFVSTALIQSYARLIYPFEASQVIAEANRLVHEAGGAPNDMIQEHYLVPPFSNAPYQFWLDAFKEARLHGPRMTAALLMVVPDDRFEEKAKANRFELLKSTLVNIK